MNIYTMYIVGVGGWCGMGGCCASYLFCGAPLDSCILVICYNHNVIFDINCSVKKKVLTMQVLFFGSLLTNHSLLRNQNLV